MQALTQISPTQWRYKGKRQDTIITKGRLGLVEETFTIPGTDTPFQDQYHAAQYIAKKEGN